MGSMATASEALTEEATGAVVETLSATVELVLPDPTCGGLNAQVVSVGRLEHAKLTLFGKDPFVGATLTL